MTLFFDVLISEKGNKKINPLPDQLVRIRKVSTCLGYIPANGLDFTGTVPIFDFQNVQKSRRPDFLEF